MDGMDASHGHAQAVGARPGGRNALVRSRVLVTTRELLEEGGYEALSHRRVARRADVNPSTVYRRWPSRAALAVDAYLGTTAAGTTVPDTGSLRGDLRAIADGIADLLVDPAVLRSFAALVAAIHADPALADAARDRWRQERERAAVAVRRAAERGEVAAQRATPEVIEVLLGPLVTRALVTGGPLDEPFRERSVTLALAWARGA